VNHAVAVLQGLFAAVALLGPGLALLAWLSRRRGRPLPAMGSRCRQRAPEWPLPLLLAASFVVSSLLVAGLQWVSLTALPPRASRCVAWAFTFAAACYGCWGGRRLLLAAFARAGCWQRRAFLAVGGIVAFWLLALPLSPYPSQVTADLGDPPAYYCHVANLVAGKGWGADYFVADYRRGQASYIQGHPIPALVTTLGFQIFGANTHSLHVYNILAGGLLVLLLAAFACGARGATEADDRPVFVLALLAALLPAHFALFGLGVVAVPVALGVLVVAALALDDVASRGMRRFVIGASLACLVGLRPEGAVLAIALGVALGARSVLAASRGRWGIRLALALGCAAAAVGLWAGLPTLVGRLRPVWQDLAMYYIRYEPASGRFVPMYEPFWEQNRQSCRANFLEGPASDGLGNAGIGGEVRAHPVAFLGYVATKVPLAAHGFVRAISVAQYQFSWLAGLPAAGILVALLVLGCLERGARPLVAAVAVFVLLLPIANPDPRVRHLLPVSPLVLGLVLRWAWEQGAVAWRRIASRRWLAGVGLAMAVVLAFLDARSIIRIRTYGPNCVYAPMLRDIERAAAPGDLVVSSYPQLVTCMTGRRSLGGSWLTENLDAIVRRHRPELILVDDANDVVRNYGRLMERGGSVPGYSPIVHDPAERYVLFRRDGTGR